MEKKETWKKQVMEEISRVFCMKKVHDARKEVEIWTLLYQQTAQLKVELD